MKESGRRSWVRLRARAVAIAATLAVALTVGFAVVVQAADPRLTEADQALQKAEALVLGSQAPHLSGLRAASFKFHVNQAVQSIERARAHIESAKQVSDSAAP
jgi:hypothetical protein